MPILGWVLIAVLALGLFGALGFMLTRRRRKDIDKREQFLQLYTKLNKIGLNRISSLIAQLATGDRWESQKILRDFQDQMLDADPLWRWWSPTFYALLDEHANGDWDTLQQKLGEMMRDKNKKWRIEFIEVSNQNLDLRQNPNVTVNAGANPSPTVGVAGTSITEVDPSAARNRVSQQTTVEAMTENYQTVNRQSPKGELGSLASAEVNNLMDELSDAVPGSREAAEIKRKLRSAQLSD